MKQVSHFLLIIFLSFILITCQEITPLTPPNPILGKWIVCNYQVYKLPAWYLSYSHSEIIVTSNDTIYGTGIGPYTSLQSLTIAADHTVSESYNVLDSTIGIRQQIDQGSWVLTDSVLNLSIANSYPHKLNYRASVDQLVTEKVDQTASIWLYGDPKHSVQVPYTIRLYFRRDEP